MGRRSTNRGFPAWYKGKLIEDDITGEWAGERSGKMGKQRGLNVLNKNIDSLTDEQREEALKRRER